MTKKRCKIFTWVINLLIFYLFLLTAQSALGEETYVFERMWPALQQPWYFRTPFGLAVGQDGTVYVVDSGNFRIQKFSATGEFITKWGELGGVQGVAVDSSGNVYITVWGRYRVFKFNPNGDFITKWGAAGTGDGQFKFPYRSDWDEIARGIAVDPNGDLYVADAGNHRIQKFTPEGQFIAQWGSYGKGSGQFDLPSEIAIDKDGYVYVVDSNNDRIQKFTNAGQFVTSWGNTGTGEGAFNFNDDPQFRPHVRGPQGGGIAIDADGDVYVADTVNDRIQKFTANGQFISEWADDGSRGGEFSRPYGIGIDQVGNVYATDWDGVWKFSATGVFINRWDSGGFADGQFWSPQGIAEDQNGNVYVADKNGSRIQKFNSAGIYITTVAFNGNGDGEVAAPAGLAVDGEGNMYVVEVGNHRIQKFSSEGDYITKWGSEGSGSGQFRFENDSESSEPGIAFDSEGNVYIADSFNHRIQKFSSEGVFIAQWGTYGDGDGQFNKPTGIAIDGSDNVFVVDTKNYRVQKFGSDGGFLTKWGKEGSGNGEFYGYHGAISLGPNGIAVDRNGNVYVTDNMGHRIQKFSSDGQYITKFGEFGSDPGMLIEPSYLHIGSTDKIYVSDTDNNRIQVFRKLQPTDQRNRAIIVAGGGPFAGNNLWDATQLNANFAYRTLNYQGFSKEAIYYLTSDTDLDLDNNGQSDDVDADATNSNLQQAITSWATDADNVVIYLVDHGGVGTFRMSRTETLSAGDLDAWLDALQSLISGRIIVIYDACESGTFLSRLTPPGGQDRIVIAGSSPGESAYFVTQGSISFSSFFWTHIFNGLDIQNSFNLARDAISYATAFQNPMLDGNGNGVGNETEDEDFAQNLFIGNGTEIQGHAPLIGDVSPDQVINEANSAPLFADNVTDEDGIARVWAVIRPPGYQQGSTNNPVWDLPSTDLLPVDGNPGRYEVTYQFFSIEGTYQIAIYAMDRAGNTAVPRITSVSVNNPLSRKAIVVAGGPASGALWPAVKNNAALAYRALVYQNYTDDDIYLLSPQSIPGTVIDDTPGLSSLNRAITAWATDNTQDLVLYLIGNGNRDAFWINDTETLSASMLDAWLDRLEASIAGKIVVIYDANHSGSFLPVLSSTNGGERILVSSTGADDPAYFLSGGDISFSAFFLRRVLNGLNIRDSFVHAINAIGYVTQNQIPLLDDSGNGIGNEVGIDGRMARYYRIGSGIMLAGSDPIIGTISAEQTVGEGQAANIWVADVTATAAIDKVWAVVTPVHLTAGKSSAAELQEVELSHQSEGRYEGFFNDFNDTGTYRVAVYAKDSEGNISLPRETTICYVTCNTEEIEAFVTRFYQLCLGRDPDPAGLNGWVKDLLSGLLTGSDVAHGFILSPEFQEKKITAEEYLSILYETFFNRQPDPAGWQEWLNVLNAGSSRQDILNGFIFAVEFAQVCDEYGIKAFEGHITSKQRQAVESFVTRFYQLCLNRDPDPAGLKGWTNNLLNQVQTGADVAEGFIYSAEFVAQNTSHEQYVTILYEAFFDREPDQPGREGWLAELNSGRDRGEVLNGFIYAEEFKALCEPFGIKPH
jgi:streptogramin lyase